MELIYFSILALLAMIVILQIQINRLHSKVIESSEDFKDIVDMGIQSMGNQMMLNEQFCRNICTLSGINPDDVFKKDDDHEKN